MVASEGLEENASATKFVLLSASLMTVARLVEYAAGDVFVENLLLQITIIGKIISMTTTQNSVVPRNNHIPGSTDVSSYPSNPSDVVGEAVGAYVSTSFPAIVVVLEW